MINPYNAGADFVLLDSQYIDQRFVYYEFKLGEEIANKAIFANGTLTFKNKELLYWTGADLLRQGMTKSQSIFCYIEIIVTLICRMFCRRAHIQGFKCRNQ